MMNVVNLCVERASAVLEDASDIQDLEIEKRDLGALMLYLAPGGFLAFLADGQCVAAGVFADLVEPPVVMLAA